METVIVAPHPDDEIIGCYQFLIKEKPVIIYDGDTETERRDETKALREHAEIKAQFYQKAIPPNFLNDNTKFFFPDPIYENHPLHRRWGHIGEQMARRGLNVIFYTTNMDAPYIHEVENSAGKEALLNTVYPSQSDLWKYEKKYVFFEGYCQWHF